MPPAELGTASFRRHAGQAPATLDSVRIAQTRRAPGLNLSTGCGLDACTANANLLKANSRAVAGLLADVVRNRRFPAVPTFEPSARMARRHRQGRANRSAWPLRIAAAAGLAPAIRTIPFSGTGSRGLDQGAGRGRPARLAVGVAASRQRADHRRRRYHLPKSPGSWMSSFGDWQARPRRTKTQVDPAGRRAGCRACFLIDKPGAQQSLILAGLLAPSTTAPNNLNIETMNDAFGGLFSARLNT